MRRGIAIDGYLLTSCIDSGYFLCAMIMKMKWMLTCLCLVQALCAETWTLTDKQGRKMEVDQLFYDGKDLSVRRVGAYNKLKISPDLLSEKCWEELNRTMAKEAKLSLEVVRRTKTSTDSERSSTTGYYTYSSEKKQVRKMNQFEISMRSSSHFVNDVKIEYFIISDEEVDCGVLSESASFAEPVEASVFKAISHTEHSSKSSYGYKYKYKSGDSKAGVVVFVRNADDEVVAEFATSNKQLSEFRGLEPALRSKWKSKLGAVASVSGKQVTIDKDLL